MLLDVELEATLRFGCREMPLGEILELGPGDVVQLDRHVSDPVDLIVGDKIVARGEVVLVNGNFGLRVTEVARRASVWRAYDASFEPVSRGHVRSMVAAPGPGLESGSEAEPGRRARLRVLAFWRPAPIPTAARAGCISCAAARRRSLKAAGTARRNARRSGCEAAVRRELDGRGGGPGAAIAIACRWGW